MKKQHIELIINLEDVQLPGILTLPDSDKGMVIFSHGSGSSRFSPRNLHVATVLEQVEISSLLLDLLTPDEDENPAMRFDIELLTDRLIRVTQWLEKYLKKSCPIGYFGASTGSAAALRAAALLTSIKTVGSRGGRPDLAGPLLEKIICPVLLIVGGADTEVLQLNQMAYDHLYTTKKLEIIPGATHLFEEPGALDQVAQLAEQWFAKFLIK